MKNFYKRSISATMLLFLFAVAFIFKDQPYLQILISIVFFISLYEMNFLLKLKNIKFFFYWLLSGIIYFLYIFDFYTFKYFIYISVIFWIFLAPYYILKVKIFFNSIDFIYGLIILFSLLFSTIHLLNNNDFLFLITLIIVWVSDIFAYLAGKFYGKTKLAPNVSPGKTIEGIYGAFIANLIIILILSFVFDNSFIKLFLLSLIVLPLSVCGDLFESLLKRKANLKDSGNLIPGHGGVLDRIDGLCSTLPIVACMSLFGFVI